LRGGLLGEVDLANVGIVAGSADPPLDGTGAHVGEDEMPRSPWFSVPGPLAQYVDGFRGELDRLGYECVTGGPARPRHEADGRLLSGAAGRLSGGRTP
jgi:hypothetical protein